MDIKKEAINKHQHRYNMAELRIMEKTKNYNLFPLSARIKAWSNLKEDIDKYEYSKKFITHHQIYTTIEECESHSPQWYDIYFLGDNYMIWNTTILTLKAELFDRYSDSLFNNGGYDRNIKVSANEIKGYYKKYDFLDEDYFWGNGLTIIMDVPYLSQQNIDNEIGEFLEYVRLYGYKNSPIIELTDEVKNIYVSMFNDKRVDNFNCMCSPIA
jgi:hypothetical protein